MDKTIPPAAAYLLDFIAKPESNGDYNTYNSFKQGKLPKKLTSMTLQEVLSINWNGIGAKSSAAGRYQIIKSTLSGLIAELGLSRKTKFTADLQDRLGYHLLRRRGYDAWTLGRIDTVEFAKRLAQEWASLPVLASTRNYRGANIKRGTSYYQGDGLNSHGVSADQFEMALKTAMEQYDRFSIEGSERKASGKTAAIIAASGVGAGAAGGVVGTQVATDPSTLDVQTVTTVASYLRDAWVIGPVFGGIVLTAIVVVGVVWYTKRKK